MKRDLQTISLFAGLVAIAAGCGQTNSQPQDVNAGAAAPHPFVLASEPAGAKDVDAVREQAKNKDDIVIVGRIGGPKPWINGRAAFSIVDRSRTPCNEIEGDKCPTPWDYCCEADLPKSMAFVTFVDQNGKLIGTDARQMLHVKELQTVVIRGKAKRDSDGNLTVVATGIYLRPTTTHDE